MKQKKSKRIDRAKNIVRGAIAQLNALSTPSAILRDWSQEQYAQQQLNKALAIARRELSAGELNNFGQWIGSSLRGQLASSNKIGAPLTSLGILSEELIAKDLNVELRIALERLLSYRTLLMEFCRNTAILAQKIDEKNWAESERLLRLQTNESGYSYWAIETELAIKQQTAGIEGIKEMVRSMSISGIGLNRFFLFHFGVRNEPAQTAARFKINAGRRVNEGIPTSALASYAKFRLYGELEPSAAKIAEVMAAENCSTVIDLLFGTLKVLRFILGRPDAFSPSTIAVAKEGLRSLASFSEVLKISPATFGCGDKMPTELSPSTRKIINLSIEAALGAEHQELGSASEIFYINGVSSQLSIRGDGVAAEELTKHLLNFSWIPTAFEFGDVSSIPKLTSYFLYPEQYDQSNSLKGAIGAVLATGKYPDGSMAGNILTPLGEAIAVADRGAPADAISMLVPLLKKVERPTIQEILHISLAHLFYRNSDVQACLQLCAVSGIVNPKSIPMLPFVELFSGVKWPAVHRYGISVQLSICLDHYLRIADDRKIKTYKRYSIEELTKLKECNSILELPKKLALNGEPIAVVEYFFDSVCDVFSLELLPGMGESRKVQRVRLEILKELASFHTQNEPAYLREAEEVEEVLLVNDDMQALDDSKVYADERAIFNYVNKELGADFQRYKKLVESGIGVSDSVNDVLRSFKNPSAATFQIPKNDADDLLAELVSAMLNRFLFDPASGVDIIVGRRIRHGTIAGEIRGVLEKSELIGHRARAGANYDPPPRVPALVFRMEPRRARIIFAAFARFSDSIDKLVARLRDEYFHVQSPSKPHGIFEVQISSIVLALARSVAQTCNTIDQFSKECIELFWFVLSVRVTAAKPSIEAEIKKTLHTIFHKLSNEIRALGIQDEFLGELQQASDELQRRAAVIASWIRVPKVSVEGKTYSMQRVVDVAVAVVSGQRPGFKPIVRSSIDGDLALETHGFSIVSDALYIALDNVSQHSGKKVDNKIDIEIKFEKESSLIYFRVESDVLSSAKTGEKEARLAEIRAGIQKKIFGERARMDRHSGLFKLAALVGQSDKTTMDFGFIGDNRFFLKFELVYVGITGSEESFISRENLVANVPAEIP